MYIHHLMAKYLKSYRPTPCALVIHAPGMCAFLTYVHCMGFCCYGMNATDYPLLQMNITIFREAHNTLYA